jgi:hypothetical protein
MMAKGSYRTTYQRMIPNGMRKDTVKYLDKIVRCIEVGLVCKIYDKTQRNNMRVISERDILCILEDIINNNVILDDMGQFMVSSLSSYIKSLKKVEKPQHSGTKTGLLNSNFVEGFGEFSLDNNSEEYEITNPNIGQYKRCRAGLKVDISKVEKDISDISIYKVVDYVKRDDMKLEESILTNGMNKLDTLIATFMDISVNIMKVSSIPLQMRKYIQNHCEGCCEYLSNVEMVDRVEMIRMISVYKFLPNIYHQQKGILEEIMNEYMIEELGYMSKLFNGLFMAEEMDSKLGDINLQIGKCRKYLHIMRYVSCDDYIHRRVERFYSTFAERPIFTDKCRVCISSVIEYILQSIFASVLVVVNNRKVSIINAEHLYNAIKENEDMMTILRKLILIGEKNSLGDNILKTYLDNGEVESRVLRVEQSSNTTTQSRILS